MKRPPYSIIWHVIAVAAIAGGFFQYLANRDGVDSVYPSKPIQIVVPFNPGGASDTFARIIQKGAKDNNLMPQPLVIVNKPGGGTSIGSSYVFNARNDGYTVLCLHEALLTAKVSGQSPHGPDDFLPVAATGEFGLALVVSSNSPFNSLDALMAKAKAEPETVILGVNLNTPTHFAGIILENTQPDTRFRFVSTGGGANRLSALMGGHLDAAFFSVSEYLRFRENGLKALAYMGEERHHGIPDVPTSTELGFPSTSGNLQYWWFPLGTDPQKVEFLAGVLSKAMKTDYVRQRLEELKINPDIITGRPLQQRIDERMEAYTRVTIPNRLALPNVAAWVFGATFLFSIGVARSHWKSSSASSGSEGGIVLRTDLALWIILLVFLYVLLMSLGVMNYIWATLIFVAACGLLLTRLRKSSLVYVAEIALLMSFGVHGVFTQVFSLSLP